MKDKELREKVESISNRCFEIEKRADKEYSDFRNMYAGRAEDHHHVISRIAILEKDLAEFKESCKPVCKTCGQKIQDGLQQGQVETLAAGLKRGTKKEKS
jgi:hypothetical protein